MAPRELTKDEVRERLIDHVHGLIDWWHKESRVPDTRGKLEGLAFGILSMLDGSSIGLPAFIVAPCPCTEDREWHAARGENWFPENKAEVACDLGGSLHEFFHRLPTAASPPQ